MGSIADLLLRLLIAWIRAHPDAAFSRFMTASRGPRTDLSRMSRIERLRSGLVFLAWGILSFLVVVLLAWLTWERHVFNDGSALFMTVYMALVFSTFICLLAALILLVRAFR